LYFSTRASFKCSIFHCRWVQSFWSVTVCLYFCLKRKHDAG